MLVIYVFIMTFFFKMLKPASHESKVGCEVAFGSSFERL